LMAVAADRSSWQEEQKNLSHAPITFLAGALSRR
jgi:hypothetical protein